MNGAPLQCPYIVGWDVHTASAAAAAAVCVVCVRACVRVRVCGSAYMRACVSYCVRVCMCACMHECVRTCVHVCLRVCVCGCESQWIGVVSRDLVGVPNWQETVKDRKAWRVAIVIHQTQMWHCPPAAFSGSCPTSLNGQSVKRRRRSCVCGCTCAKHFVKYRIVYNTKITFHSFHTSHTHGAIL